MQALFSVREVARIFGLNESRIRYWAQTGFINPSGSKAGRRQYNFRDLVGLKAAVELLERGIPLQRVRKSLQALREALPGIEQPLTRLRVCSDGDQLVVAEPGGIFEPLSGQLVLDFEIESLHSQVVELLKAKGEAQSRPRERQGGVQATPPKDVAPSSEPVTAHSWFLRGCACDPHDPDKVTDSGGMAHKEAMEAFQRAIELDPSFAAAHTNLGNLYYRIGERAQAREAYEKACALEPEQPQAHYNLANLYEEEGELDMAIAEYRRSLNMAPDFADAHFNLALTLEQVGSRAQALWHWHRFIELRGENSVDSDSWLETARSRIEQLEARTDER